MDEEGLSECKIILFLKVNDGEVCKCDLLNCGSQESEQ